MPAPHRPQNSVRKAELCIASPPLQVLGRAPPQPRGQGRGPEGTLPSPAPAQPTQGWVPVHEGWNWLLTTPISALTHSPKTGILGSLVGLPEPRTQTSDPCPSPLGPKNESAPTPVRSGPVHLFMQPGPQGGGGPGEQREEPGEAEAVQIRGRLSFHSHPLTSLDHLYPLAGVQRVSAQRPNSLQRREALRSDRQTAVRQDSSQLGLLI